MGQDRVTRPLAFLVEGFLERFEALRQGVALETGHLGIALEPIGLVLAGVELGAGQGQVPLPAVRLGQRGLRGRLQRGDPLGGLLRLGTLLVGRRGQLGDDLLRRVDRRGYGRRRLGRGGGAAFGAGADGRATAGAEASGMGGDRPIGRRRGPRPGSRRRARPPVTRRRSPAEGDPSSRLPATRPASPAGPRQASPPKAYRLIPPPGLKTGGTRGTVRDGSGRPAPAAPPGPGGESPSSARPPAGAAASSNNPRRAG